jgi:hypothetical protein
MRTYLRIFNPLITLLIFILCSFAAVKEEKDKPIVPTNIIAGGIPTYFFAKGDVLWRCSSLAWQDFGEPAQ